MTHVRDSASNRDTVLAIFRELAGERANRLDGLVDGEIADLISRAIGQDYDRGIARDIAFHAVDWTFDAAFIIAVHLFPERFTAPEIKAGITNLLVHAPNHLAAAAKLAGHPISDVFGVGNLLE